VEDVAHRWARVGVSKGLTDSSSPPRKAAPPIDSRRARLLLAAVLRLPLRIRWTLPPPAPMQAESEDLLVGE
jgi:hypothetical protein